MPILHNIKIKSPTQRKKTHRKCVSQRVEKAVNSEKSVPLHAERTSRNRDEFRFLANGCCTTVPPLSKKRKTPNSGKDSISLPLFKFICWNGTARTPSPAKEDIIPHALLRRGSADFIDSQKKRHTYKVCLSLKKCMSYA